MHLIRRLLAHRRLALLICTVALLLKLLVPGGYMIADDHGRVTITLCPGSMPQPAMATPAHGATAHHAAAPDHGPAQDHGTSRDHGQPEMPCAFTALSATALGAADPLLLVALIAFVMAAGLYPVIVPAAVPPARLRPPLRAPPAYR